MPVRAAAVMMHVAEVVVLMLGDGAAVEEEGMRAEF